MMKNSGNVYFLVFVVFYSMITLTGLRAYAIMGNATDIDNRSIVEKNTDVIADNELSFLERFVFEDTGEPLVIQDMPKGRNINKRSASSTLVPQYMMHMYEYLSSRRYKVKFDTARSYGSTSTKLKSLFSKSEQNFTSRQLLFNISSFPVAEKVQFAQLRIQLQSQIPEEKIGTKLKIEVHSMGDQRTMKVSLGEAALPKNFLLAFNLTDLLQAAAKSRILELNLAVEMSPPDVDDFFVWDTADREGPQLLLLSSNRSEAGVADDSFFRRMRRSLPEGIEDVPLPNIVEDSFRKTNNISKDFNPPSRSRKKRSEEEDEEAEEQSNFIVEELGRVRKGKLKKKKNPCKRKPLHVNFAAINYDQWIIAPLSYEAFECSGKCSFPMSAHLTPTKHAIIQTLMHSLEPKQISRACCVPTKLNSMSVLYIDDDGAVIMKYDYEDMIVSECGCR